MMPERSPRLALFALLLSTAPASAQDPCPSASADDANAGWAAYVADDMDEARRRFSAALGRCDNDQYARTGLGYVELRAGEDGEAERLLTIVVTAEPNNVDALVGLGLVAWRAADLAAVQERFSRVAALDPGNETARDYLERIEGRVLGPPPDRPALERPVELRYPARTNGNRFEIRTDMGWEPFYIKGVNLGAALPGRHPSEFPDSATYALWVRRIAEMNANAVRVYTIHPPAFYDALHDWNAANPDRVLYLVHGAWTELPEDHDYRGAAFEEEFFAEMRRVVDVLHGRADVQPRAGHAAGYYTSDVSPWTLAYVIGREWEPFSAVAFDSIREGETRFDGRYLQVSGGSALDAWLARASEHMIAYETETYNAQRPIAFTNWPTLDPLDHPTEATVDEEMAIRRALGERPDLRIREYDNDRTSVDAALVSTTERLPAGYFASYHAYPYYPDFMLLEPGYRATASTGRSSYFGYLRALADHHPDMPVVISEYGTPASTGVAHLQPQGWHHGGLTEAQMAEIDRRLTIELADAGLAGGLVFSWIDEWFKKNWVPLEFELPADRNRLWYNRLDAEQHFGMWAMEARPPVAGRDVDERRSGWADVPPLYREQGLVVRAAHDAAYLWLLVESPGLTPSDTVMVGFDVFDPGRGDFAWPGRVGSRLPVGIEFVLRATADEVRVMADPPSNPFRLVPVGGASDPAAAERVPIDAPPPDLFHARVEQRFNLPYYTEENDDGVYDSLRVVVNRRRFARDSTEYLGIGYDRGLLPAGPAPDGLWERSADGGALEVRIPWLLVNVTDPSSRTVLQGPGAANVRDAERGPDGRWRLRPGVAAWPDSIFGEFGTQTVTGIGIVATVRGPGKEVEAPAYARPVATFGWPSWERPEWVERPRPVYDVLTQVFRTLDPFSGPGASRDGSSDEADAAWRSGDTDRALELYEARLSRNPRDGAALHRVALMRAWQDDHAGSLALFDRLRELEPGNVDARVDRARVQAWSGDTDEALRSLGVILGEHPEHAGALEARALFLAWAGRYSESLTGFERLLAIVPEDGSIRRQRAVVLGWASDFEGSRAAYVDLLERDPGDHEARVGLATTLAFSGDLDGAVGAYDEVLGREPGHRGAVQGKGRVLGWAGRLAEAEDLLRGANGQSAPDAGTLAVLGQVLQWQGRDAAAKEVLEEAVRVSPTHAEARDQLRSANLALAPLVRPTTVYESDSDGNRMWTTALAAGFHPVPRLDVQVDGYRRRLEQNGLRRSAMGGVVTGSYQLRPGWTLTASAGASRTDGVDDPTFAVVRAGVRSPERGRLSFAVDAASGGLDETAALAERGVRHTSVTGSVRWTPGLGWRVDGSVGRHLFRGSERNSRNGVGVTVARALGRTVSVGGALRAFGYERDLDDGYFDPDFYGIGELTAGLRHRRPPWAFFVDAAPGVQRVTSGGDPTFSFRGSARTSYEIAPRREVSLSFSYSSASLLSLSAGAGDAGYDYRALVLGVSWVF